MSSAKFGIDVRRIRKVKFVRENRRGLFSGENEITKQVKKILTDTDQKLILMVRG